MQLTVLGCGSALPMAERNASAQMLRFEDADYLIDCGEGTQLQIRKFGLSLGIIKAIFISHLHGDHYLGLMGLLWTMELLGRRKPISLVVPKGIDELISLHLRLADAQLSFDFRIESIEEGTDEFVYRDKNVEVRVFAQDHRIPCFGFVFTESPKLRNLIKEKIIGLGLPVNKIVQLREGLDVLTDKGDLIRAADVSYPPVPRKKFVYCTDTAPQPLPEFAQGADLLYHEATYDESLRDRAERTFHSTAFDAALVAEKSSAKQLMIGHFSSRYKDVKALGEEAITVFPNTVVATDGLTLSI